MKLFIKNWDTSEKKEWLIIQLEKLCIIMESEIRLGEVVLKAVIPNENLSLLKKNLAEKGMEIIYDRKQILAEQVKYLVYEMLAAAEPPNENYSSYISSRLYLNYTYLANIFSDTQEITIEHFIINQRIEKVKGLLLYSDHNISQIADFLHYSSVGHLSNQFKKVTGSTPSEFKRMMQKSALQQ